MIGYHNSVEAALTALEHVHSRRVRPGLVEEFGDLRLDLPGGTVTLDRNRQAVRDGYLSRVVAHGGKVTLEPVRVVPRVEQTFGGLLSTAPPAWARLAAVQKGPATCLDGPVEDQPAIVQVNRVSLSRGARPPGRTPRRTSTAGDAAWVASAVRA